MNKLQLVCVGLLLVSSSLVSAGTPDKAKTCIACHGPGGVSNNPEWPNLAGQKPDYLANQLTAFRDGQRENTAMIPFVKGLSDADIQLLANYFSELPATAATNGDAALVARGENLAAYCKACHGMKGKPAASVWPNLAGQQGAYLQNQLAAFKSGERQNAHMQTVLTRFGEDEFKALAAYYSQLEP